MYCKTYLSITGIILGAIGLFNVSFDPLWYDNGNNITKMNLAHNERLTKTNLLSSVDVEKYDCLILGSSRLTLLSTKALKKHNCFNYSFSAGTAEEYPVYAKYAKEEGIKPKRLYVGIDNLNFLPPPIGIVFKPDVKLPKLEPLYKTYFFSIDVLKLSFKEITKGKIGYRCYDEDFQGRVFSSAPKYEPKFLDKQPSKKCDFSRIKYFKQLHNIFPDAEIIGYVAPVSPWKTYNDVYAQGLLDCQAQGIYNASKNFDVTYDFAHPSEITENPKNTYDGSHYYPNVHDKIAKVLEGEHSDNAIIVNRLTLKEYQQIHRDKMKEFLQKYGKGHLW